MRILVVGATGQLGFTICKKLEQTSYAVVAAHRPSSDLQALNQLKNTELRLLDLLQPETFPHALAGVKVVVVTANTASPTQKKDAFFAVDEAGIKSLIDQCVQVGVRQFIYVSTFPFEQGDERVPLARAKRSVEKHLRASDITFTIFQPTAFMEVYFPFFGTDLPLKNSPVNTVERPFKFSNNFFKGIRNDMAEKGQFNIIGDGQQKCSFISIESVADFCVQAIENERAYNQVIPIGGPDVLTPLQVKSLFEEALGKPLKTKSTPVFVMKLMAFLFSLFNPAAANIFALNHAAATNNAVVAHAQETAKAFGVQLLSAQAFIRSKLEK